MKGSPMALPGPFFFTDDSDFKNINSVKQS